MGLRDYFRGLRRHWIAIFLMTIVGLAASYGWVLLQTPVYQASASGLIQTREIPEGASVSFGDSLARSKVETYLDMASWQRVADEAASIVGLDPSAAASRISVANPRNTAILRVTAVGASPREAAALAEAWIVALGDVVDEVEGGPGGESELEILVASAAAVPTAPIFPVPQTALIVGAVMGLGFGIAFALIRTVSDRRIRSAEDVESHTGLSVVGAIPVAGGLSGDERLFPTGTSAKSGGFAVAESLRALRTNLQFMDVDNPPRTIVVTSPLPGDGKSSIACNLAVTLALSGRPVVLVDGDLRRSTVAETMGVTGGAGLSDVLAGRAELTDVLQRSPHAPSLFVLAAGSSPPNPSEVLGSARMRTLLTDLARHAVVIIDAPPLLPVTDGAVLTHQADGAIVVVSLGKTTYDLLDKALDTLQKSSGRALGIVINRSPSRGVDAASYSYEYRRAYAVPDVPPNGLDADTLDDVENVADEEVKEDTVSTRPATKPKTRPSTSALDALFATAVADDAGTDVNPVRRQRVRRE
ncbi:tyrosine-protein kinase domain-containing protein [Microbacterium aureliae]